MFEVVDVRLGERSYQIRIGPGAIDRLGEWTAHVVVGRQALVVTDENVAGRQLARARQSLVGSGFSVAEEILPPGETTKTMRHASALWDHLVAMNADRQAVVIALGGGVIGDLAGFAAATFARGVPFVQVPTTLLAMVDASVGGKVAVDHPGAKNMIGAFHQPKLVVADLNALATLPEREFRCGLAECVKHAVTLDADLFTFMETSVDAIHRREPSVIGPLVAKNCAIKARIVEKDEFERTGQRAILNYGHTFAHAFETAAGYGQILHGEAVSMGMGRAAELAQRLGRVDATLGARQEALLGQLGLPTKIPASLAKADLISIMRRDKKARGGNLQFVLPNRNGAADVVAGIPESLVEDVLASGIE